MTDAVPHDQRLAGALGFELGQAAVRIS